MSSARLRHRSFEDRYVAFVDILGFREIVKRMRREHKLFLTVRDALKTIDEQSQEFRNYRVKHKQSFKKMLANGKVPLTGPTDLQMTAFSDCYVVSETHPAWHVLAGVQALGASLLEQGILSRGAVVRGSAYHRGRVLFGPAVIEAYDLERDVAKYPRILVSEEVREAAWGYHEGRCENRLFVRDTDGCWFINVLVPRLSGWKALSGIEAKVSARRFFRKVRSWLTKTIDETKGDLRQLSKLRWLKYHFNRIVKQEDLGNLTISQE